MTRSPKKKIHHFVHHAYIEAWRTSGRIFAFDLVNQKGFEPTGRNSVGAIGKYNNFSFDETVIALLNDTFADKAIRADVGGIYRLMLVFTNFMKDFDHENKTENLLEDFHEKIEARIGWALRSVFRGELQIVSHDPEVFDSLIFLYCVQLMRTPKARRAMADTMARIFCNGTQLRPQQKDEYIKMHLFISSLAMAVDILNKGCVMRLRHARTGEKLVNSDAPVIVFGSDAKQLEDHRGCIPLSPRLLMEVDAIGIGSRIQSYADMPSAEVEMMNRRMIANADRAVYFSSNNLRIKYMDQMLLRRPENDGKSAKAPTS